LFVATGKDDVPDSQMYTRLSSCTLKQSII